MESIMSDLLSRFEKGAAACALILPLFAAAPVAAADDGGALVTIDQFVSTISAVPSMKGKPSQIFVRERVTPAIARGTPSEGVVLFVHGAGTPAEVAFDVPYQDYSWMGYLARAGFDVFAMDMTGYGRSTRPATMNDPCNLSNAQQLTFVPGLI